MFKFCDAFYSKSFILFTEVPKRKNIVLRSLILHHLRVTPWAVGSNPGLTKILDGIVESLDGNIIELAKFIKTNVLQCIDTQVS